jgi:hypothetical protein
MAAIEPVKVWNDNVHPFSQKFKEEQINIPAKGHVKMQWDDAQQFLGTYFQPQLDGSGIQKAESYKMLRIEGSPPHLQLAEQICAACGDKFASEPDLNAHIDRHHLDELEDQKLAQKRRAKRALKDGTSE